MVTKGSPPDMENGYAEKQVCDSEAPFHKAGDINTDPTFVFGPSSG